MTERPDIDIEAERTAFIIARTGVHYCDCMLEGWLARARIAAEREREMQADIERLRSIVAMFPTTADSVVITQGKTVYVLGYRDEPIEVIVEEMRLYEDGDWWIDGQDVYPAWQPQDCYSTIEAALKGPSDDQRRA